MILEGNERGHGAELARHLLNTRDNDHVTVHAVEDFIADDLFGAFAETEAISGGTQCQKYLFSLSLNPPSDASVPIDVFEQAIADIERKLGLVRQPRAIVFHEKLGRRRAHCVWSRIDAGQMKAIKLSHYKRKLMDISRDLYRTYNWDMPEGFKDRDARDPLNFSRQEAGQAKRAKRDPKAQKAMFQKCWVQSDSRAAFAAALWEQGHLLARGDRRGFVAVDQSGKVWSLSRWCGAKPKELRARLGSEDDLWSVEVAIDAFEKLSARAELGQSDRANERFEQRLKALIERQRGERTALEKAQVTRRDQARLERKSRLPRGFKAIWARATGRYEKLIKALATEATSLQSNHRAEMQATIERHLAERRALEEERTQPDMLAELQASFEKVTRPDPRQHLMLPRDDIPFSQQQLRKTPELILECISEKDATFSRTDVLRALAQRIQDPMALKLAADTAMASTDLVPIGDEGQYTTKDYVSAEAHLKSFASILSKRVGFGVKANHIDTAIAAQNVEMQKQFGGSLIDEQRASLHHILGDDQLANVIGIAGAGKSTMLKTAHAAWGKQGVTVHGAALAGKAADGLESASGIPSRTLSSLETSWKNGYEPIKRGDILVIDEAGMIGTRQLRRVAQKMHEIGAKLVLIGDPDQLQTIEAGTPSRTLIENHGASYLTEIHRQKHEWQRQASRDLSQGKISEAISAYAEKGAVSKRSSRETTLAALVVDYVCDIELNGYKTTRLAFAHRRKDVFALNQAIRAALRSSGDKAKDTLIETETGPRAFAPCDRVVFTRNDKALGVKNGQLGSVETASSGRMRITLDSETGERKTVTINPHQYNAIDHGYAVTIHKSQGATIDRSFVLASSTMDEHLAYVSMTRHRHKAKLFINEEDRPKWASPEPRRVRKQWRELKGPKR